MFTNLKSKTLLYAEDELGVQAQYGNYFKNIFKEVYLASDGKEAHSLYEEKKPDAVILDINMPGLSGLEVTKIIKKCHPDTPVILLTSRTDKETLIEAVELQLVTYLEKPISRENLKYALNKLAHKFETTDIIDLWESREHGLYVWNKKEKFLYMNDTHVKLTKKETLLLELFLEKRSICTYQDIYEYVWENDDKEYNESTIKTLLSALKSKLPESVVKNQYGVGYILSLK